MDGLRGIAALAVVCYHLNGAILETYGKWLPGPAAWLLSHGYLGVDIFFVISGFVIAYSVRNAERSLGFLGRFAVRRSIRLDPPYWAAILVEIAVLWAGLRWGLAEAPLPSVKQFLSHFLYLQNILGYGDIINIFWTLCFEIQFYLGLVLLLLVHRRIELHFGARSARLLGGLVLAGLFLYSLAVRFEVFGLSIHPSVALLRWFQFFLGVCVFWTVSGRISRAALFALWGAAALTILAREQPFYELLPIGVSGLLLWSYQRDQMASLLSNRPLQFLGAISYSLYLFHSTIGWRLIRATGWALDPRISRLAVVGLFLAGVAICVLITWLLWLALERPSLRLSRYVSLTRPGVRAQGSGVRG